MNLGRQRKRFLRKKNATERYTAPRAVSGISGYSVFVNSVNSVFWAAKLSNDSAL